MKTKYIIIFIIIITYALVPTAVISQSLANLDKRQNFKEIKIGDSYQKWESKLQLIKEDGAYSQYVYKGDCCKTLFDLPVGNIGLIFKNNTLLFILIEIDKNQTRDFTKSFEKFDFINESFKILFGHSTSVKDDVNSGVNLRSWQTNKTILATKYSPIENSDRFEIKVFIADRSYFADKINSGF